MISPESQQIDNVIAEKKSENNIASKGKMDMTFFGMVILLLTVGLVMLFSSSYAYAYYNYDGNSYKFIGNQALFAVVGVAVMIVLSFFDYRWLKKFHLPWILYARAKQRSPLDRGRFLFLSAVGGCKVCDNPAFFLPHFNQKGKDENL